MAGTHRGSRPVVRLLLTLGILFAWIGVPHATDAAVPRWTGGVDLYRAGTFTTQKSWLWCTAADVQIMRNIVDHQADHSTSGQRRYFTWMRGHNRYSLPLSAGVDPAGWTAGLRHFVDDRYRLVASTTFTSALRSAVKRLRQTNLPVAITVSHGNHGWILTGFRATADPLVTSAFRVTSVRVVGPLWGLQSRTYGYDMRPDKSLTVAQFRTFFTPWKYRPRRMIWDGRYVSIQPVPRTAATASAASPRPAVTATSTTEPLASPGSSPTPSADPTPTPAATAASSAVAAAAGPASSADPPTRLVDVSAPLSSVEFPPIGLMVLIAALVVGLGTALRMVGRLSRVR
jgi:hypothetical protein